MGGRSSPFCNSSNGGFLNLEDCVEVHDSDFALFGVCRNGLIVRNHSQS
jgi:hypothetical protein